MLKLIRKWLQCKRGIHWRMKYNGELPHTICSAGECLDCGEKFKKVDWPRE